MTDSKDTPQEKTIFITAGEASGDILGASLVKELNQNTKYDFKYYGVGGDVMEEQGFRSLFPMRDLSVMGILEVIPNLRKILKRIKQVSDKYIEINPDVLVTIDSPDFSFRVAKRIQHHIKKGSKTVHYVSPTVWAWREERAEKVAKLYDSLFCLLPFEPPYFENLDIDARFVGHPVLEQDFEGNAEQINALRQSLDIKSDARVVGVLFGSRKGELKRLGPQFIPTLQKLSQDNPNIHIVSLTLPHLKSSVESLGDQLSVPFSVVTGQQNKWNLFSLMDVCLAASGTAGLELAVSGTPHCIGYRAHPLTHLLIKYKIKIKYAHLCNILLDKLVVPEFLQYECTPNKIYDALDLLLNDSESRTEQQSYFHEFRKALEPEKGQSPSKMAADHIISLIESSA